MEELDCLEAAAAQRFGRNPDLGRLAQIHPTDPILDRKRKRPHKESLLQQHELRYFGTQYEKTRARVLENVNEALILQIKAQTDPGLKFEAVFLAVKDVEARFKAQPNQSAQSLISGLSMYLSAPPEDTRQGSVRKFKRKHFLSRETAHLATQLGEAFNELEVYGKFLDLTVFYDMYKTLFPDQITYGKYLTVFSEFVHKLTSADYVRYLESLLLYLIRMHECCYPLKPLPVWEEKRESEVEDGKPNSKGEVFCRACDKLFAKETVYKAHLSGKKHKKNAEKNGEVTEKDAENTEKNGGENEKDLKGLGVHDLESRIQQMARELESLVQATVADYERRSTLSDREKMLEHLAVDGEESEYTAEETASEAEEEEDDDDFYSKDLPIGTDGAPIPLWLYKLQGLHRSYNCEICGNIKYKGRQQFTKHFGLAKHVYGLMCLGIGEEETSLFDGIHTIAEAQELWAKIKKTKRNEEEELENVEIEDDDGNVMSHKDFVELKKQGLI